MTTQNAQNFRLTVLNPGGGDPEQQFHSLPGPGEGAHPPINFHAFAACSLGAFHFNPRSAIAEDTPVLLLLRSDFRASERALSDLKKQGRIVAVSLKETGLHQIAQQLCNRAKLARFMKIVAEADGCIATTPEAAEIYQRVRLKRDAATVAFIPTPYPVEDERWNFSMSPTAAMCLDRLRATLFSAESPASAATVRLKESPLQKLAAKAGQLPRSLRWHSIY